ncbi:pyocin knob domain-containing protein [Providencia rettgeri]|uniref:pyocin knob domain-containing protein n=1 Tax=Providencia rettgeri TaxID=587 RepID=UPI00301ABBE0
MYGLDNASGVNVMPNIAPVSSATPLWFTEGGAGLAASYPGQDWYNMVQAELLNVLTKAGLKPEKGKLNQLAEAIAKMISNGDFATNEALKNITSQVIFNRAIAIPLNADLNDYVTPGLYFQPNGSPGSNDKNYPSNTAGSLEVIKTGNTSVKQIYTAWYDNQTWVRRYNGSNKTWSDKWDEDYTKLNPPTAEAVGAYSKQQADAKFQQKGDYVDKNVVGEQVLKGTLAINGAAYVMSSGAGSDLLCIDSRYGKFGFLRRINGTYGGVVEVPYVGGTIALVEQTIGINQTWKNVTSNRGVGVSYTNTSKKPIFVALTGQAEGNGTAKITVDGVTVATLGGVSTISINRGTSFIVPPSSKYMVENTAVISTWSELS